MSDKFQQFVAGVRPQTATRSDETQDDPAQAAEYRAIRRVRTFAFPDVWFTDHTGLGQAFQWAHVRRMIKDGKGTRLTLIWTDGEVALTGRHLDRLEEDIQRRIIAEFYQITPGTADQITNDQPVITSMKIAPIGENAAEDVKTSSLSLVVPET
jgi:hypothetical protein